MIHRPEWAPFDPARAVPPELEDALDEGPEVRNVGVLLAVMDGQDVEFGGRVYSLPPVPFRLGLQLTAIREEWDRLADERNPTPATARGLLSVYKRGIRLLRAVYVPQVAFGRLRRWVGRNPFRNASPAEFTDLVLFALVCRRKSSIRYRTSPGAATARSSTRQTSTSTSRDDSRPSVGTVFQ